MAINIGNIFDLILGKTDDVVKAVNDAQPTVKDAISNVQDVVGDVKTLINVGKSLFEGKKPDPAELAAAEAMNISKDQQIASS